MKMEGKCTGPKILDGKFLEIGESGIWEVTI